MFVLLIFLTCIVIGLLLGLLQDINRSLDHEERIEELELKFLHEYEPLIKSNDLTKRIDDPLFFDFKFENHEEDYEEKIIDP